MRALRRSFALAAPVLLVAVAFAGCFGPADPGSGTENGGGYPRLFDAVPGPAIGGVAAIGYLDGDDTVDLVVGGTLGTRLLLGKGDGSFTDATAPRGAACAGCRVRDVAIGDVTNDSLPDIVVLAEGGIVVYANDGNATFEASEPFPHGGATAFALADLDGDGELDLVLAGAGTPIRFLRAEGGRFPGPPLNLTEAPARSFALTFVDDDLRLDLVLVTPDGRLRVLLQDPVQNATFVDVTDAAGVTEVTGVRTIMPVDHDNDQQMDLLVAGEEGVLILANTGRRAYRDAGIQDLPKGGDVPFAVAADFNNDGWSDVLAGFPGGDWRVLQSDQGRGFNEVARRAPSMGTSGHGFAIADLDGDGRLDVVSLGEKEGADVAMNRLAAGHHFALRLRGNQSNPEGIGAKTTLSTGTFIMMQQAGGVGTPGLAIGTGPRFGLGADPVEEYALAVLWPSGILQFERTPAKRIVDQELDARESMSASPWDAC